MPLLERLAAFYNLVEDTGVWPKSLQQALVTLIPKGDGANPIDMRPISVMSAVYRLWACARLVDVKRWQEQWASPCHHGYTAGHGPEDIFWSGALHVEDAC